MKTKAKLKKENEELKAKVAEQAATAKELKDLQDNPTEQAERERLQKENESLQALVKQNEEKLTEYEQSVIRSDSNTEISKEKHAENVKTLREILGE